ncbi:hypothetical protein BDP27DRAFT_1361257 [Rhodocollybia butyracea]|uniref:Fungal STAND N-terminal Goodbye domain-containing protein n=1 Tax=Rhodocollybia butyracea TaxID=206335 RepID=A0A9P5U9P6_9AGAR|nr:hypothetical protein BDP27DRAFT_1361257 [Rhodocollybia butyracea]
MAPSSSTNKANKEKKTSSSQTKSLRPKQSITEEASRLQRRRRSRVVLEQGPPKRLTSDTLWDVSDLVLETIKTVGAGIPFLAPVSALAWGIFKTAQRVKKNKNEFKKLAHVVCSLVATVMNTYRELHFTKPMAVGEQSFSDDPLLNKHFASLVATLRDILGSVNFFASRHFMNRLVASQSDLDVIQDYHDRLDHARDIFQRSFSTDLKYAQLQSYITLRQSVSVLQKVIVQEVESIHASLSKSVSKGT